MQKIYSTKKIKYNLRNKVLMSIPEANTQRFGTQSFLFRGSLLWNQIPEKTKLEPSLNTFKSSLKQLNLTNICLCKICKGDAPIPDMFEVMDLFCSNQRI